MKKYRVRMIVDTWLYRTVEVEAKDEDDAEEKAGERLWDDQPQWTLSEDDTGKPYIAPHGVEEVNDDQ